MAKSKTSIMNSATKSATKSVSASTFSSSGSDIDYLNKQRTSKCVAPQFPGGPDEYRYVPARCVRNVKRSPRTRSAKPTHADDAKVILARLKMEKDAVFNKLDSMKISPNKAGALASDAIKCTEIQVQCAKDWQMYVKSFKTAQKNNFIDLLVKKYQEDHTILCAALSVVSHINSMIVALSMV